jgi:hypothetical protein
MPAVAGGARDLAPNRAAPAPRSLVGAANAGPGRLPRGPPGPARTSSWLLWALGPPPGGGQGASGDCLLGRVAETAVTDATHSAARVKLRFSTTIPKVVIPTRLPLASNSPPPLDPGDTDAVAWMRAPPSHSRRLDTNPSARVFRTRGLENRFASLVYLELAPGSSRTAVGHES